jgi:erythronate-4-phosphate dehydrogenase
MIYQSVCAYFGQEPVWQVNKVLPETSPLELVVADPEDWFATVRAAVLAGYDIAKDDAQLRVMKQLAANERPAYFDRLRRDYPVRREFSELVVRLDRVAPRVARVLEALGFREVGVAGKSAAHRTGGIPT